MSQNVRIIVCGGTDFTDDNLLETTLNAILKELNASDYSRIEIVSGHAQGADRLGERYANSYNLPLKIFEAEWSKYGKAAGPMRNSQMIQYAQEAYPIVVAFWDGYSRGTQDTLIKAKKNHIKCYIVNYNIKLK